MQHVGLGMPKRFMMLQRRIQARPVAMPKLVHLRLLAHHAR